MSPLAFLLGALVIGIGGGLGAVSRWGVQTLGVRVAAGRGLERDERVKPWMTFLVNVIACFLLGVVVARLGSATGPGGYFYAALGAGFCGGLSTLSTAAHDIVDMVRRGEYSIALAYLMLSAGVGMGALWVGLVIAT
ncbi:fluoride efflux transporter FluC [Brachybacterium aquaticum]|uniref:Fluoride-specific ion channel FluC n=1 Tax=Brachybacterium aquaticum TaxID=1432564 RepID=A0A841A946_9MICO|nr:CrcB family protein [Brachybacterium aquaticum]MBB5830463.1 CrcB protein [Brachybacterium aquaticum]